MNTAEKNAGEIYFLVTDEEVCNAFKIDREQLIDMPMTDVLTMKQRIWRIKQKLIEDEKAQKS